MNGSKIDGEWRSGTTCINVQTHRYETADDRLHRPSRPTLVCLANPGPSSRYLVGTKPSDRRFSMGDLLYLPPGQSLWGWGHGHTQTIITCSFSNMDGFDQFDSSWDDEALAWCADIQSQFLIDSMRRLGVEALEPGFGSDILFDALTRTLPVEFARYLHREPRSYALARGGLTPRQLRTIEDYVEGWPGGRVTVGDLATLVGLSRSHLMRAYKQSTGKTIHNFVEDVRLQRAKQLLRDGKTPIKQISAELGFANTASFSLAFRRKTGEAPGRYGRRMRTSI